jgi:hypothetical protein
MSSDLFSVPAKTFIKNFNTLSLDEKKTVREYKIVSIIGRIGNDLYLNNWDEIVDDYLQHTYHKDDILIIYRGSEETKNLSADIKKIYHQVKLSAESYTHIYCAVGIMSILSGIGLGFLISIPFKSK